MKFIHLTFIWSHVEFRTSLLKSLLAIMWTPQTSCIQRSQSPTLQSRELCLGTAAVLTACSDAVRAHQQDIQRLILRYGP